MNIPIKISAITSTRGIHLPSYLATHGDSARGFVSDANIAQRQVSQQVLEEEEGNHGQRRPVRAETTQQAVTNHGRKYQANFLSEDYLFFRFTRRY